MDDLDTVTILRTMRAVVADTHPRRFDMMTWFDRKADCGCIVGLAVRAQPHLAAALDLRISHGFLQRHRDGYLFHRDIDTGQTYHSDLARLIGITRKEAKRLFDGGQYEESCGAEGKAEALRRLDDLIAKYSTAAVAQKVPQ